MEELKKAGYYSGNSIFYSKNGFDLVGYHSILNDFSLKEIQLPYYNLLQNAFLRKYAYVESEERRAELGYPSGAPQLPLGQPSGKYASTILLKNERRTLFTVKQKKELQSSFNINKYLTSLVLIELIKKTNLNEKQIRRWFSNKRNKKKKYVKLKMDSQKL
uniref:Homeobox domain-containing protein n=1 Tax=viral metagenome TaxID=1070528 RepID=A0A6C0JUV9_9ZZZZ